MWKDVEQIEDRLRLVAVDERQMMRVFEALNANSERLAVPEFTTLPRGYRVQGAFYDPKSREFFLRIQHPEFSPVPPGSQIPVVNAGLAMKSYVYQRIPVVEI